MPLPPSQEILNAVENGVVEITRRIGIFENDGITPWYPDIANPETDRLVSGSITIDYNTDERRKADLVLRNDDFALRLNPRGGFYYDKIIKVFRGVRYPASLTPLRALLVDYDATTAQLNGLKRALARGGIEFDIKYYNNPPLPSTYAEVKDYDVIFSFRHNSTMTLATSNLLKDAWAHGKHVLTIGIDNDNTKIPLIATDQAYSGSWGFQSNTADNPLKGKLTIGTGNLTNDAGREILTITAGTEVAAFNSFAPTRPMILLKKNSTGTSTWVDLRLNNRICDFDVGPLVLTPIAQYLVDFDGSVRESEWQLGEFMIDGANDQIFPNQIKLTLRDYTKKLLKDKISFTESFAAGTSLRTFIRAIAANGGITKMREAIGTEVFPNEISYERMTPRWQIIKEVCTAFDYEAFFDAEGYFVVRKFNDPTLSPIYHTFQTGTQGNLVSFDRSLNDSRIYNIIRIYGDPINNDRLPYFGEAVNDDPNSPTSTVRLGNRPWEFAANYFGSDQECLDLARSRLRIMGLESYEINFSSIFYPWMEVGEIVEILDPHRNTTDPTRFLMDSITLPLELAPMGGTGKRVTLVGSQG